MHVIAVMRLLLLFVLLALAPLAGCVDDAPPRFALVRSTVPTVLVIADKRIARPTEVVGVLDFHSNADDEEKGFDELRARAADMGAEAVIGAEFEHGEGGRPSHLSGMAVRFVDH